MKGKFTLLGTGGSMGIPVVGCSCAVCSSENPKNRRLRSTSMVEFEEKSILIDAGPDLRQQLLARKTKEVDALLFTHSHQDHVGGIDDLRALFFYRKSDMPVYLSKQTHHDLKSRFGYIFKRNSPSKTLLPSFEIHEFEAERGAFDLFGLKVSYFTYSQVGMQVQGFRFGDLAFVSDIKEYPETLFEDLRGVKTLVVSALREEENHIHFTVEEAIEFGKKVGAERVYFTHVAHELEHEKANAFLPSGFEMAYDGLELEFSDE